MGCGCKKTPTVAYEWTNGKNTMVFTSLMAAKARVIRRGGTYKPVTAEK